MSDPSTTDSDPFMGFQATLYHIGKQLDVIDRMEKWLTEVCLDVDELKHGYIAPAVSLSGVVSSTTARIATLKPLNNNADNADEEGITTRLTWASEWS